MEARICLMVLLVLAASVIGVNSKPQSCAGVSCLPNPGGCQASYSSESCCPVWNCQGKNGGAYSSYGLSRIGGGPGSSFAESSIATSSSSGGGLAPRIGGLSNGASFPAPMLPRLLSPNEIFAIVRSAFPPGWFNGAF